MPDTIADQALSTKAGISIDRLALAVPQIKKSLIEACVQVVGVDGFVKEGEAKLFHAVADALDCPIPPFVEES